MIPMRSVWSWGTRVLAVTAFAFLVSFAQSKVSTDHAFEAGFLIGVALLVVWISRRLSSLLVLCTAIGISFQMGALGIVSTCRSPTFQTRSRHPICKCMNSGPNRTNEALVTLDCTIDHGSQLKLEFTAIEYGSLRRLREDHSSLSNTFIMDTERTTETVGVGICYRLGATKVDVAGAAESLGRSGCQIGDSMFLRSLSYKYSFAGRLEKDKPQLLFVVGDTSPDATTQPDLAELRRCTSGSFLVCTATYAQPGQGRPGFRHW